MLPGYFDHQADIRELVTYAIVNGVRHDVESVSLDRELSNDLPKSLASGAGLSGGSGTIVWATSEDVASKEPSPWSHATQWPPSPGDEVRIFVSDHVTAWPRFTGVIDKTRGTVGGQMVSDVVDFRDRLNEPFTLEALLGNMPPIVSGGSNRTVGLRYFSIITLALRQAGFYSTPPAGNNAFLSVPFQGTSFPEVGTVTQSHGANEWNFPDFYGSPWGFSVGSLSARYEPRNISDNKLTDSLQVGFLVDTTHAGDSQIRMMYGSRRIRLRVWSNRQVSAYLDDTTVVVLSPTQMLDSTRVILLVHGNTWTLRTNTGKQSVGTQARSGTDQLTEIRVDGTADARIAGLTVIRPADWEHFREQYFTPDATFLGSVYIRNMDMSPRFENANLSKVVDDICQATLTAGWFDETGILRFVAADWLNVQGPSQKVSALDDIVAADWETSLLDGRRAVHIKWKSAAISRSRQPRIELYRASSGTLDSGDVVETFATPASDEEWFGVDRRPRLLNDSSWSAYASGRGSFMGVHYTDADGEVPTSSATTDITYESIGTAGVKITHQAGSYPSGVEGHLAVSTESPVVREHHKGANLPVIRGYVKGVWVDETYLSPIIGDESSPDLVHNFGPWGTQVSAEYIGDFLAARVSRANPTIHNLRVTYDPRRQIGDVIDVELGLLGVTLRALIAGIHETQQVGEYSQSLKLRIIDITSDRYVTYQELEEAWSGGDYSSLRAVWMNLKYEDFKNDPLRFAPSPRPTPWAPLSAPKYVDVIRLWGPKGYDQMRSDLTDSTYESFPRDLLEGD